MYRWQDVDFFSTELHFMFTQSECVPSKHDFLIVSIYSNRAQCNTQKVHAIILVLDNVLQYV